MRQMTINPEDVEFRRIEHNGNFPVSDGPVTEFISSIHFQVRSTLPRETTKGTAFYQNGEDTIRRQHLAKLDHVFYGQFRNILERALMDFVHNTMNKYYIELPEGHSYYRIPYHEIYDIYDEVNKIIRGIDEQCPVTLTNAETAKT